MKKRSSSKQGNGDYVEMVKNFLPVDATIANLVVNLPVDAIVPNPKQPRKKFNEESIDYMAHTMEESKDGDGIKNPLSVTPMENGSFKIIDGERRWRAAKKAQKPTVRAIIKLDMSEDEVMEESIVSNFCKEDMTLVEKALGIRYLMQKNNLNQSQVAKRVGLAPAQVSNILKIFLLDEKIIELLLKDEIDPVVALPLASYHKAKQAELIPDLKEARYIGNDRKRRVAPQIALRDIRRLAEKREISALRNKKGKNPISSTQMTINSLTRLMRELRVEISEFKRIKKEELDSLPEDVLLQLISHMELTGEALEEAVFSCRE